MPQERQRGSAAQRREQERQQRQRREEARVSTSGKPRPGRGPMVRKKDRSGLYLALGALVLVGAFIAGILIYNAHNQSQPASANPGLTRVPADAGVVQQVTAVSQPTWETVGTGGVSNPFHANQGQPLLKGSNGHPQFFYVGGEFCPYCAAERWAMVNALSRFGTFSHLSQIRSFEDNIPTFSFYQSSYSSQYVDFVPVEVKGNAVDASGQQYVNLETMTAEQQQMFLKFNSSQSFPFIDVGNQYTTVGASYNPLLLTDGSLNSWQNIANALSNPQSTASKGILGTANYMTAAICNVTGQQPGNVCTSPVIQQIAHTLGKTSRIASANPLASAPADLIAEPRRVLR